MKCYNLEDARSDPDKVTELFLRNCGITEVPELVFQMPRLHNLQISDNPLEYVPRQIGQLRSLRTLKLSGNNIKQLPDTLFELKELETLDLTGNQLIEWPALTAKLTGLKKLVLSRNAIGHLPKELSYLLRLECLEANHNSITGIAAPLKWLLNLRRLLLSHNQIRTFPKVVCQLSRLERLDLSYNQLRHIPLEIGQLKQLTFLSLERNNLKVLPEGMGGLHMLRQLNVGRNKLTEIPSWVWALPWLSELKAERNAISVLTDTLARAERLESLNLSDNKLYELPAAITALSNLRMLDVGGNQLSDMPYLPDSIRVLSADYNPLQTCPAAICELSRLEKLHLRHCGLSALPDIFQQMDRLKSLHLNGNDFEDIPPALFHLIGLTKLEGVGTYKKRKELLQFIRFCNSRAVPKSLRRLMSVVKMDTEISLDNFSIRELLSALSLGYNAIAYRIRVHLLRDRSKAARIDLRQPGERVFLLGDTGFDKEQVRQLLEKHGLQLVTDYKQGADYFVLGRLSRHHDIPPVLADQKVVSRLSLTRQLDADLNRRLPMEYKDSQIEKLRLMLFHREEKNRKLALQLIQSGGVPTPLVTDLFMGYKLGYEPRRSFEDLLLQNCSEEALHVMYESRGLQRTLRGRRVAANIEYYTEGNELDALRMRRFIFG